MDTGALVVMIIVSFCLAAVIIMQREHIPHNLRRPLAIFALVMVVSSFVMLLAALFRL
jgi:Na+-translocating ferredoxin:NAD+ oxidoreductase RnfE subunit